MEGGECDHRPSLPVTSTGDWRGGSRKAWERENFTAVELLGFSLHLCHKHGCLSHGWQDDLPSIARRGVIAC